MTGPIEMVDVECPECGTTYETHHRRSLNLELDDFDQEYVEDMSTGVCPHCGHRVYLETLVVNEDGVWHFSREEGL